MGIEMKKDAHAIIMKGKELIDSHDVVFFDVFDTLIVRNCSNPCDIFDYMEESYNSIAKMNPLSGFRNLRTNAEVSCYRDGFLPGIEQIYERIPIDAGIKESLKELEIETELQLCAKKYLGWKLYNYALAQSKMVYAVSDMYLSTSTIEKMLAKCGYRMESIFVSCEHQHDKKSGLLFQDALESIGISNSRVVHFGDNYKSDILGARKAEIDNMLIPKEAELSYQRSVSSFGKRYLDPFIKNRILFFDNQIRALGYEICGPLILGFCQWLHEKAKEKNYQKLLFCARDMYQTYLLYKRLYPEEGTKVEYLYVSLKSLITPYRAKEGLEDSDYAQLQLKTVLRYLSEIAVSGKIAMIDSGLGGHTQKMLSSLLPSNCELHGLYMRMSKNYPKNIEDVEACAYLFEKKPEPRTYICGDFFENMIQATHGRTEGYECNQETNIVQPVLGDPIPQPELLEQFQDGIRQFADDYLSSPFATHRIEGRDVEDAFLRFAFFPRKKDVDLLKIINGGNAAYQNVVIKREKYHYLRNPVDILKDLKNTSWKGGYLCSNFPGSYKVIGKLYLLVDCTILEKTGF